MPLADVLGSLPKFRKGNAAARLEDIAQSVEALVETLETRAQIFGVTARAPGEFLLDPLLLMRPGKEERGQRKSHPQNENARQRNRPADGRQRGARGCRRDGMGVHAPE